MSRYILVFVLGLAFVVALSFKFPAHAQSLDKFFFTTQYCGPWSEVIKFPKKYKEAMLFTGDGQQMSTQSGKMFTGGMFFFVNQDTGSFTVANVYQDGMACIMAVGKNFTPYTGRQPWDEQPSDNGDEGDKG